MTDRIEYKTVDELDVLVRDFVERHPGPIDGHQWKRIIQTEPDADGVNWRLLHGGASGGHGHALDRAEAELRKKYRLASPPSAA